METSVRSSPELSTEAGAAELAAAVDTAEVERSMDEVRRQVRRMLDAGQPVPVG